MTVSFVCASVCLLYILSVQTVRGGGHGDQVSFECKQGWTLYDGYCYLVVEKPMAYNDAKQTCNRMSGDLWYGEVDYFSFLQNHVTQTFWTGLYREGSTYYNNGDTVNIETIPYWANYQPDMNSGSCVSRDESGLMLDNCDQEHQSVCWYPACIEGFKRCAMDKKCVHREVDVCDGNNDCQDMSDEMDCSSKCRYHLYLENNSGTFSTPPINSFTDCQWYLEAKAQDSIKLTVPSVTNLRGVFFEVYIYNLITGERSLKAKLTGQVDRQDIYTDFDSNIMILRVYSQGFTGSSSGQIFSWTTDIPLLEAQDLEAGLSYANLNTPMNAPDEYELYWNIRAPAEQVISFNLESRGGRQPENIPFSYKDGYSMMDYTDMNMDTFYVSGSNMLMVRLKMDSTKDKNVYLQYQQGCTLTIQDSDGYIRSPGYEMESIPNNLTCDWVLDYGSNQPSSPGMIVKFTGLDLESDPQDSSKGDIIQVFTDANLDTDPIIPDVDQIISADTGRLRIRFQSDYYLKSKKFSAYFGTDCPQLSLSTDTQINPNTTHSNENVVLSCLPGYQFDLERYNSVNSLEIRCFRDEWFDANDGSEVILPQCQERYCGVPSPLTNGFILNVTGTTPGDRAWYDCYPGFDFPPGDDKYADCGNDGKWTGSRSCTSASCNYLQSQTILNNGGFIVKEGNDFTQQSSNSQVDYNTVIEFICDDGYELIGWPTSHCRIDGWTHEGNLPTCQILKCPQIEIENAVDGFVDLSFGNSQNVACSSGYEGGGIMTCEANQEYDTIPECIDMNECDGPNNCDSDSTVCVDTDGDYRCDCKPGFEPNIDIRSCVDINECNDPLTCDQRCSNSPVPYECSCNSGYQLFETEGMNGFYSFRRFGQDVIDSGDIYEIGYTCVRARCPALTNPEHGRFLKGTLNKFLSGDSVKFRCEDGYRISTTQQMEETISCLDDGQWDKEPICIIKTCPIQTSPNNGVYDKSGAVNFGDQLTLNCTLSSSKYELRTARCIDQGTGPEFGGDDITVCTEIDCGDPNDVKPSGSTTIFVSSSKHIDNDASFVFRCESQFELTGSSDESTQPTQVRCKENGNWGFGSLKCTGRQCSDPGTPGDAMQSVESYEVGQELSFVCNRNGYKPVFADGAEHISSTCEIQNGVETWNLDTLPVCKDVTDPVISGCPTEDLVYYKMENINLPILSASDNSGDLKSFSSNSRLRSGDVITQDATITYTAEDYEGNTATCIVNLRAIDIQQERPNLACPVFLEQDIDEEIRTINITNDVGIISSNGVLTVQPASITVNANKLGTLDKVVVTATRTVGTKTLTSSCTFLISYPRVTYCHTDQIYPDNNRLSLIATGTNTANSTCRPGYTYRDGRTSQTLTCNPSTGWNYDAEDVFCLQYKNPTYDFDVSVGYSLNGLADNCKANFETRLDQSLSTFRNRISSNSDCSGISWQTIVKSVEVAGFVEYQTVITFTLTNLDVPLADRETCREAILTTSGLFDISGLSCPNIVSATLTVGDVNAGLGELGCADESYTFTNSPEFDQICIPCGPGNYYNTGTNSCSECADDQYQPVANQYSCINCPNEASATAVNIECMDTCPEGFYSTTGMFPCSPCPVDQFWLNSKTCEACPNGGSTLGTEGVTQSSGCYEPCSAGTFSYTGYVSCMSCPNGFFQAGTGQSVCSECPAAKTTPNQDITSAAECVDIPLACPDDCNGNGNCDIDYHRAFCECNDGFSGDRCQNEDHICDVNPCTNGATCEPGSLGQLSYTCSCRIDPSKFTMINITEQQTGDDTEIETIGVNSLIECEEACLNRDTCDEASYIEFSFGKSCFIYSNIVTLQDKTTQMLFAVHMRKDRATGDLFSGGHCETDLVNECDDAACDEDSRCMNKIDDFQCLCPEGKEGELCTQIADPCTPDPCQNSGICDDYGVNYECTCRAGFTGRNCENNIDECNLHQNACLNGGTCIDEVSGYRCACAINYGGSHCEQVPDYCAGINCLGDNECFSSVYDQNTCYCDSTYFDSTDNGASCSERETPCDVNDECGDNGTCSNTGVYDRYGFTCTCQSGFTGSRCQRSIDDCLSKNCNEGTCLDGHQTSSCECNVGFTGEFCNININDCDGINCNDGRCEDGVNVYTCVCDPGYTGSNCEINIDDCSSYPCQHSGICVDDVDDYTCTCPTGWIGKNCQTRSNQFCSPNPCNGASCYSSNGEATDFFCICEGGNQGELCQNRRSTCDVLNSGADPCVNGFCLDEGPSAICSCDTEYSPEECSFDGGSADTQNDVSLDLLDYIFTPTSVEACQERCKNNIKCAAITVTSQEYCLLHERDQLRPVAFEGSTLYIRNCPSHYSGDSCEFVKDWCSAEKNPCGSNGNCEQLDPKGYRCDCLEGYTGSQCETYTDPCSSNPCGASSGATCRSSIANYICECPEGKPYLNGDCSEPDSFVMLVHNLDGTAELPRLETRFLVNSDTLSFMMWVKVHEFSPDFKLFKLIGYNSFSGGDAVFKIEVSEDYILVNHPDTNSYYYMEFETSFFNPDLYNKEWHLFGCALKYGQFSCNIDTTTSETKLDIRAMWEDNIYFEIHLGEKVIAEYENVRVWNRYLTPTDFTLEAADQSSPSGSFVQGWWNYLLFPGSSRLPQRLQDTYTTDDSKVPPTLDCDSVMFNQPIEIVPTGKYLSEIPELKEKFDQLMQRNIQLEYKMANLPEYFDWGLYNAVILGFDPTTERYGECRFPIYVKYNDVCPTPIKHDSELSTGSCSENSGVCSLSCSNSGLAQSSPVPRQIPCGSLGVYDQMYPNQTLVLPTCTSLVDIKYIVNVKLVYSFVVNCQTLASELSTVEQRMRQDLLATNSQWTDICADNDCTNMIFGRAECRPTEADKLDVEFSVIFNSRELASTSSPPTVLSLEDVFRSSILMDDQFDSIYNLGSASLVESEVEVDTEEGCSTQGYSKLYSSDTQQYICAPCGQGHYVNSETMVCTICSPGTYQNMDNQLECKPCPDGTTNYEFGEVNGSCTDVCQPGQYYNGNGCVDCERHRYQSEPGKNFCHFCKYNYKTATTGADSPDDCKEDCPAGEYRTLSQECVMCPRGEWRSPTFDDCQQCPDGRTTMLGELAKTESDCAMDICDFGEYWSVENDTCISCPEGSYQDELYALVCKECSGNLTTANVKSTSNDNCTFYCAAGYEVLDADARTCKACERGNFKTNEGSAKFESCVPCPSDTTDGVASTHEANCSVPICEAGQIIVDDLCSDCPLDTYSMVEVPYTSTECMLCTDPPCDPEVQPCELYGTTEEGADNSTMCKRYCEAGKELVDGECQMCKRGYYKDNAGNTRFESCKPCSTDGSMITDEEGADSQAECNKPNCTAGQSIVQDGSVYVCQDCELDTYQELISPLSTDVCTPCPDVGDVKYGTESVKSTSQDACQATCPEGQEYDMNVEQCVECPISQYKMASDRFGECQNCTEGYVAPNTGATSINDCTIRDCGPGTKIVGDQCEPCPVCSWQDQRRMSSCNECGTNLCTLTTGATAETECTIKCEAGFEGTETCLPCKDHYYKPEADFGPCIQCEEGTTSSPDDRTACNLLYCHYGKELKTVGGTETCVDCEIGFYKEELGNEAVCIPCPESYTTTETGQKECLDRDCLPGFTLNGTECDACVEGTYKADTGNMACTPCPENFTTNGTQKTSRTECNIALCPVGEKRNDQQPSTCLPCEVNYYQPASGSDSCIRCTDNRITLETGAISDEQCVPLCMQGQEYNSVTKECDPCQQGYYKSTVGNVDRCTQCREGRTTVGTGSTSSSNCDQTLCDIGTYGVAQNNQIVCYPCEIGFYKPEQGQAPCTRCPNGQTTFRDGRSDVLDCFDPCQPGYGFAGQSRTCVECDVHEYNDAVAENDPLYCKICPSGFDTLQRGSTSCNIPVPTVAPRVTNINVVIVLNFVVGIESCDSQFTNVLLDLIRSTLIDVCRTEQSNRFRNGGALCGTPTLILAPNNPCALAKRRKRADYNLNVQATFNNVSSTVTNPDTNSAISTEDALANMLLHNEQNLSPAEGSIAYTGYDENSIRVTDVCPPGTQLDTTNCVSCTAGTYWEDATCKDCGTDTYQDETEQTSCKLCPALTYNDLRAQTSQTACLTFCSSNPNYCNLRGACTTTGRRTASCACYDGYEGDRCQSKSDPSSDMDLILGLAIGGGGGLLLIILAIVGIYKYLSVKDKKKYKQPRRGEDMGYFHDPIYDNGHRANYGLPHFQSVGYPALGYRPEPSVVDDPQYSTVYKKRPSANMDRSYDNDTFVWQA